MRQCWIIASKDVVCFLRRNAITVNYSIGLELNRQSNLLLGWLAGNSCIGCFVVNSKTAAHGHLFISWNELGLDPGRGSPNMGLWTGASTMNPMIPTNILFEMLLGFRSKTFHDSSVNPFPCHNMGPVRTENSDAAVGSPPPPVTTNINIFPKSPKSNFQRFPRQMKPKK